MTSSTSITFSTPLDFFILYPFFGNNLVNVSFQTIWMPLLPLFFLSSIPNFSIVILVLLKFSRPENFIIKTTKNMVWWDQMIYRYFLYQNFATPDADFVRGANGFCLKYFWQFVQNRWVKHPTFSNFPKNVAIYSLLFRILTFDKFHVCETLIPRFHSKSLEKGEFCQTNFRIIFFGLDEMGK